MDMGGRWNQITFTQHYTTMFSFGSFSLATLKTEILTVQEHLKTRSLGTG